MSTSYGYDLLGRQVWTRDPLNRYGVTHDNAAGETPSLTFVRGLADAVNDR